MVIEGKGVPKLEEPFAEVALLAFSSGSVLGLSCTCFGTHSLSGEEGISHALSMGM